MLVLHGFNSKYSINCKYTVNKRHQMKNSVIVNHDEALLLPAKTNSTAMNENQCY